MAIFLIVIAAGVLFGITMFSRSMIFRGWAVATEDIASRQTDREIRQGIAGLVALKVVVFAAILVAISWPPTVPRLAAGLENPGYWIAVTIFGLPVLFQVATYVRILSRRAKNDPASTNAGFRPDVK